jgi:YtkA-like
MRRLSKHGATIFVVTVVAVGYATAGVFLARSGVFEAGSTTSRPVSSPASHRSSFLLSNKTNLHAVANRLSPGPLATVLNLHGFQVAVHLTPNQPARPETVSVQLSHAGRPVNGARVRLTFSMLDMPEMGALTGLLPQTKPGTYSRPAPTLMAGHWQIRVQVTPRDTKPFSATITDPLGA